MLLDKKIVAVTAVVTFLSACGFDPLYVEKTSGDDLWYYNNEYDTDIVMEMAQIRVVNATDRIGQMVKNELIDIFNPRGAPRHSKYFLKLSPIKSRTKQQALRNDITATREKVKYTLDYSLWSEKDGKLVSGQSWIFLSYDLLDNPYSTSMDKKKVEKDGAKILANEISLRIGAYFHSMKTKRGNPNEF